MKKRQLANLAKAERFKKGTLMGAEFRFKKEQIPWNKGLSGYHIHFSEVEKQKRAERIKKNRHRFTEDERSKNQKKLWSSPEYHRHMSRAHKGKALPEEQKNKIGRKSKELWKNPVYRDKVIRAQKKGLNLRPTKTEKILIGLIQKHKLPYEYVGDGSVVIYGLCPDFIECNGKKKIIELFGNYWHTRPNTPYHQTEEGRKTIFKRLGYDTLVIWGSELEELDKVLEKIKKFDGEITAVEF